MTDVALPEARRADSIVRRAAIGDEAAFAGSIAACESWQRLEP